MTSKKFSITAILITTFLLVFTAGFMIVVDPYFHFHGPFKSLGYPLVNEYYQNAGIAKNFEYEAMVAGDSMTQNVSTSVVEELWGYKCIKLPNPGAPFLETDGAIRLGLENNADIKLVIRALDDYLLNRDPVKSRYRDEDMYLYDYNPFNDVRYVFEKETIVDGLTVLTYSRAGKETISFDDYSRSDLYSTYGDYDLLRRMMENAEDFGLSGEPEEIYINVKENVKRNVIQTALDYPDVDFMVFMPPYSACYWKELGDLGLHDVGIGIEKAALEEILKVDNIRVFSFMDDYEITTNWNNYSDEIHYPGYISDYITREMFEGRHEITLDNLTDYLEGLDRFYKEYDYSSLLIEVN